MVIGVVGHEPTFTCAWVRLIVVKPLGPDMVQEGFEAGGLLTTQEKVTGVEVFLRTRVAAMEKLAIEGGAATHWPAPEHTRVAPEQVVTSALQLLSTLLPEQWLTPLGEHAATQDPCRFRKLHPLDSRSPANQNMIAGCSQLPSFSSACCATVSSRDDGLKPKSWCCGINSTSCSSVRRVGYI